jgi:hypothetical protein
VTYNLKEIQTYAKHLRTKGCTIAEAKLQQELINLAQMPPQPVTWWTMADTGYKAAGIERLEGYLANVPPDVQFITHLGDQWPGSGRRQPPLEKYQEVAERFKVAPKPMLICIGDNEFNDTLDPLLSLDYWRQTLGKFWDNHPDGHRLQVSIDPDYPEHWHMMVERGIHVGLSCTGGKHRQGEELVRARAANGLAMLEAAIAKHNYSHSLVIHAQSIPTVEKYWKDLWPEFERVFRYYDKPVLWLQGNKHKWKQYREYKGIENLDRYICGMTGNNEKYPPLKITSTGLPQEPWLFSHDKFSSRR